MSDNIPAVSDVNNKGRIKSEFCNEIEKELWVWSTSQNMWVSAAHIPGTQSTEADSFPRNFNEAIEWKLKTRLSQKISSMFENPALDLFGSCINYQIVLYVSWKPDSKTLAIHAFSIKWKAECYYVFPRFSLLGKVTAKIYRDKTNAIVVILKWSTQYWHLSLLRKATRSMTATPSAKNWMQPQDPQKGHLLHQKLHLQVPLIN